MTIALALTLIPNYMRVPIGGKHLSGEHTVKIIADAVNLITRPRDLTPIEAIYMHEPEEAIQCEDPGDHGCDSHAGSPGSAATERECNVTVKLVIHDNTEEGDREGVGSELMVDP